MHRQIISIFFVLIVSTSIVQAQATFLNNFTYYREITITERSGQDLTDFQIPVVLNESNFNFSHAQPDGDDIRFADENGTLLDYWIEEWNATAKRAKIWVKVPHIPANSSTKIYMYYGNASAKSLSNGSKVFPLFDDFEDPKTVLEMKLTMADSGVQAPILSNIYQGNVGFIYKDRLYIGFIIKNGLNCVAEHNLTTNETKIACVDYCTADVGHGGSHLAIDKNGYIYMFIGGHGTELKVWKTVNPLDISEWVQVSSLPVAGTYPQPFVLPDNTLIVIYRGVDGGGQYIHMAKSTDGGLTWSDVQLTRISTGGADNRDYPFAVVINNTIYLGIGRHIDEHYGICFMMSKDGGKTWTKADGTPITLPATLDQVDQVDLSLYGFNGFPMPVGDKIVIPYVLRGNAERDAILKVAIWNGTTWTTKQLSVLGKSSNAGLEMGLIPLNETHWVIYTGKVVGSTMQLFKWETKDGGETWTETQLTNFPESVGRVSPVWDYINQTPLNMVFFGYGSSSETATIMVYPNDIDFPIPSEPTNWNVVYTGTSGVFVRDSVLRRDVPSGENSYNLASLTAFDFPAVLTIDTWNIEVIGNIKAMISDQQGSPSSAGVRLMFLDDTSGGGGTDYRKVEVFSGGSWSTVYSETVSAPLKQDKVEIYYDLNTARFVVDGKELANVDVSVNPYYIFIPNGGSRGRSVDVIDTIYLRKFAEPEPSVDISGEYGITFSVVVLDVHISKNIIGSNTLKIDWLSQKYDLSNITFYIDLNNDGVWDKVLLGSNITNISFDRPDVYKIRVKAVSPEDYFIFEKTIRIISYHPLLNCTNLVNKSGVIIWSDKAGALTHVRITPVKISKDTFTVVVSHEDINASETGEVLLNMTIIGLSGGDVVSVEELAPNAKRIDIYHNGEYYDTVPVEDGKVKVNLTVFSEYVFVVNNTIPTAPPPEEGEVIAETPIWVYVIMVIVFAVLVAVVIYLSRRTKAQALTRIESEFKFFRRLK